MSANQDNWVLSDSNNFTFGVSGGSLITASFSQSNPTITISLSGNTFQTSSGTVNATGIVISGAGAVTVGQLTSPPGLLISAAPETPFAISAAAQSVSTGTMIFSNSNNVSFGMSGSSRITASATLPIGISASSNTAGNTATSSINVQSLTIVGAGDLSVGWSTNDSKFYISYPVVQRAIYDGANSISSGTARFSNSNNVSFGFNGQTVTASIVQGTNSIWENFARGALAAQQAGQSTIIIQPMALQGFLSATRVGLLHTISVSTSSNSSHAGTLSINVGIYTNNASTLSLASSGSTNYQWTVTGSTSSVSVAGLKLISVPLTVNMTPGDYWIAYFSRTAVGATAWYTASNMVLSGATSNFDGYFGSNTNATQQMIPGLGFYSVQTAAFPNSIGFNQITGSNSAGHLRQHIVFNNITG